MDLKDMILVMENYKGTERNMLMTLEDYKKFVAIDDMSELADQMLLLGRTLAEGFTEYYRAANVTVFAKFCRDDVELGRFLQGYYNDSKKFYFDKATSSPECITKMDEIGMTDRGWIDDFILHYEKCDRTFERGQTFHNFNDHDYMVLEALSPRNLVVMAALSRLLLEQQSISDIRKTRSQLRITQRSGYRGSTGFILVPHFRRPTLRHIKENTGHLKR